jgi:hypothetical protein
MAPTYIHMEDENFIADKSLYLLRFDLSFFALLDVTIMQCIS